MAERYFSVHKVVYACACHQPRMQGRLTPAIIVALVLMIEA
jgi:hypothetical protein